MEKVYIKEKEVNSGLKLFLKPEYIYIPIDKNKKYKCMFKSGDYVYRDDIVVKYYDNYLYSPVSGYIRGNTYKYNSNGIKDKYIVIENDYKDKYKNINDKSSTLMDVYSRYDGGTLVINAIDMEPYIFSKRAFIKEYSYKILEIIDYLVETFNIKNIYIALADNNSYDELYKYIGTYPKIKLIKVNNYYGISNDRILLKELFNIRYRDDLLDKKMLVLDILSLNDIFNLIKKKRPKYEKIITIGGNMIKNTNIKVKTGTSFKEIVNFLGGYKDNEDLIFTVGGPLSGKQTINDDIVITGDITSIFVTKKNMVEEKECTLCGKCSRVCPVNLMPVFIANNIDNKKNLSKLDVNRCTLCGLCSYVCPSFINLKEYINKAKGVINNE